MSENPVLTAINKQEWLGPVQTKGAELVQNAFAAAGKAGQSIKNALHGTPLGHPLHPAITDVPVGSWTVAAVLDVLEATGESKYKPGSDAAVMIGLVSAIPAALSGVTDWSDTHGQQQRVGAAHGLLNMAAAGAYAASYIARKCDNRGLGRTLGWLGFGLVFASAYLGGELSYTLKTGVNHAPDRSDLPKDFMPAMAEADLPENKPTKAIVDGTPVLLVKRGAQIYALADTCSHLGGPLSEGKLEGDSIVCPWHGSRFCLKTGNVLDGPATANEPAFDMKVEDGKIFVRSKES